ncbi:MAG: hypothetical protein KDE27_11730 [Planctomycetes bacterium]|nr:hypothetical protein [Planctomycetota bacterium]
MQHPTSILLALLVTAPLLPAQAGQLVGTPIDATTAVRSALGFGSASNFAGACRDNTGAYWTTCEANGQVLLVRISPGGTFSGFITTNLSIGQGVRDLAFDGALGQIWVGANNARPKVYDASTGAYRGDGAGNQPGSGGGLAWNGGSRIHVSGTNAYYSTSTLGYSSGPVSVAYADRGLLFDPTTSEFWGGKNSGDPGVLTTCEFQELPNGPTMPPHLEGISYNGFQGGRLGGCEQWLDPVSNEWLGVFCQLGDNDACMLYTARLGRPTGPGCGGPAFYKGPAVVQTQVYSSANQAQGLTWLLISLAPGSVTDPLLGPGCVAHLNGSLTVALGPVFPNPSGQVSAQTSIPVDPSLQELPLWFQWGTITLQNVALLGDARNAVVKQF